MRFAGVFYAVFISLTLIIALLAGSGEMFAYAIFANLLYAVIGGIGWVVSDRFIGIDTQLRSLCSILLGMIILNLIVYFGGGGALLTPALFGRIESASAFRISLSIHIIFLISFFSAQGDKRRNMLHTEE
ncbi:hypothetical protein [Dyadobacter endophyticus]|uniref:hypothetical protein n=1 Tax=Dyadobacter TaxID=120831 RepID=UPI001667A6AE|nr:hypothetical protein [Dyadobacter endophyticus]